jgi:hypothetical protein
MGLLIEAFPDHLQAIGVITVRWSSIDGDMYDILKNCLPLPEKAEKLWTLIAGQRRFECFLTLLKDTILLPEEKDALADAVDQLVRLWKERNYVAHGQYGIIATDDGVVPSWSDFKTGTEPAEVTKDHLDQHATDVLAAARPLRDFLHRRV